MDLVSSFTNEVVKKSLDGTSQRHTAIASNLANVDTPGYRRKLVSFEDQLQQAIQARHGGTLAAASNDRELVMRTSNASHLSNGTRIETLNDVEPVLSESDSVKFRNDRNAVDVETEMVALAKNTQRYIALNNLQGRMLRSTRNVINNSGG